MSKRSLIILILLLTLTLGVRLIAVYLFPVDYNLSAVDSDGWGRLAEHFASGKGYVEATPGEPTARREPVFVLWLSLIYFLFGIKPNIALFFNCLFDALTALVIYRIAVRIYQDQRVALLSILCFAFYYPEWLWLHYLLRDSMLIFLMALFMFGLIAALEQPTKRGFFFSGLLLGVVALCKATTQFFPLLMPLVIGVGLGGAAKRIWQMAVIFILGFILAVAPWVIRNYITHRGIIPRITSYAGFNLYFGNNLQTDGLTTNWYQRMPQQLKDSLRGKNELEQERIYYSAALADMLAQPKAMARLWWKKFLRFWFYLQPQSLVPSVKSLLGGGALYLLAIIGYFLSSIRQRQLLFPALLLIGYLNLVHLISYAGLRHALPVLPYLMIMAALALIRLGERMKLWKSN